MCLSDAFFCLVLTFHKPITKADAFKRFGLTPPRGILLYGPPGCVCAYVIDVLWQEKCC